MTRELFTRLALCVASFVATNASLAQDANHKPKETMEQHGGFTIPSAWTRRGLIMERQKDEQGSSVSGDPCIVWDDAIKGWRMVFFHDPPDMHRRFA